MINLLHLNSHFTSTQKDNGEGEHESPCIEFNAGLPLFNMAAPPHPFLTPPPPLRQRHHWSIAGWALIEKDRIVEYNIAGVGRTVNLRTFLSYTYIYFSPIVVFGLINIFRVLVLILY